MSPSVQNALRTPILNAQASIERQAFAIELPLLIRCTDIRIHEESRNQCMADIADASDSGAWRRYLRVTIPGLIVLNLLIAISRGSLVRGARI